MIPNNAYDCLNVWCLIKPGWLTNSIKIGDNSDISHFYFPLTERMSDGTVADVDVTIDSNEQRHEYAQNQETQEVVGVTVNTTAVTHVTVNVPVPACRGRTINQQLISN